MDEIINFPTNPFEDIKPSDFNKLNKKHVTEDFVEENLKNLNWDVFAPFNDTGIDRIIVKTVCPNGHTSLYENLRGKLCSECHEKGIEITRFIQVKTRRLVDNTFGFTLKSKDIRIDPRHVYLLYSDNTTNSKQDFLVILIKDLLSFFIQKNVNPFSSTSFRKGNNKVNDLKYKSQQDKWFWQKYEWESFRNLDGIKKIQDPKIDLNLRNDIMNTRLLADRLQRKFSTRGKTYSRGMIDIINSELYKKLDLYSDKANIVGLRSKVKKYLICKCSDDVWQSSMKYLDDVKIQEATGVDIDSKDTDNKGDSDED